MFMKDLGLISALYVELASLIDVIFNFYSSILICLFSYFIYSTSA